MTDTNSIRQETIPPFSKGMAIVDPEGTILFVNQAWNRLASLYGLSPVWDRPGINLIHHIKDSTYDINSFIYKLLTQLISILNGHLQYYADEFYTQDQDKRYYLMEAVPLVNHEISPLGGVLLIYSDITAYKNLETRLEEATNQNRTLRGLLPICAVCKKIKDEQDKWNSIEDYLTKHIQAEFTHDICPDCIRLLYPQYSSILDPLDKLEDV